MRNALLLHWQGFFLCLRFCGVALSDSLAAHTVWLVRCGSGLVSVIVSVFMLGLGLGAIVGGWLADLFQHHRILAFSLIEFTIGAFGVFSLGIMDGIGALFAASSLVPLMLLTFVVFVVPTCAMGATLPVLVTELVERSQNVGLSTGGLYFINTLGAAFGAFAAGFVLVRIGGLDGLVATAATLNILVSIVAFIVFRRNA